MAWPCSSPSAEERALNVARGARRRLGTRKARGGFSQEARAQVNLKAGAKARVKAKAKAREKAKAEAEAKEKTNPSLNHN